MTCKCGYQFCWHCRRDYFAPHNDTWCKARRFAASKKWGPGPIRLVTKAVGFPVGAAAACAGAALLVAYCTLAAPVWLAQWHRRRRRRRRRCRWENRPRLLAQAAQLEGEDVAPVMM